MLGPVEGHVLDHVGQAQLILVLEDRAGVDDQAQFGPVLRLPVLADVITEAVPELADRDLGVDGDLLVEGILVGLGGERGDGQEGRKGDEKDSALVIHPFYHRRFGKL